MDIARDFCVDTWADVEFITCHSKHRVPGLATKLVSIGVEILKKRGVKVFDKCQKHFRFFP